MGKLATLLRWHKVIVMKDEHGRPLKDEKGKAITITMRIIGDKDLEDASKKARLASGLKRLNLLDDTSEDYKDQVAIFNEADKLVCIQMIMAGEGANWSSEALSNVERPDEPTLEEVAKDPDAPTLEELEILDAKLKSVNEKYLKELEAFVIQRQEALLATLQETDEKDLREMAKKNVIITASIETYLNSLLDEKVWRSVFSDKEMQVREFNSLEEFANHHTIVKNFLREEYQKLESGFDDIKN